MELVPEESEPGLVYRMMIRAITPRPIAWVSTISDDGILNLAPFSYFNGVGSKPAALVISPVNHPDGSKKDTVRNIEQNGQFVVNVVPFSMAEPMVHTAGDFGPEVSEFSEAGVTATPSRRVAPARVAESPIHFECELFERVEVGSGALAANVIIGRILLIHVDDQVLDEKGKIDPARLDTIGRMGGLAYCRTTNRFELKPPTVQ